MCIFRKEYISEVHQLRLFQNVFTFRIQWHSLLSNSESSRVRDFPHKSGLCFRGALVMRHFLNNPQKNYKTEASFASIQSPLALTPTSGMRLSKSGHSSPSPSAWLVASKKCFTFVCTFSFKLLDASPEVLVLLFWCLLMPRRWQPCHACHLADRNNKP